MKKHVSQIDFLYDYSNPIPEKARNLNGRSKSNIFHLDEAYAEPKRIEIKFYNKSDIFNISGSRQVHHETKNLEHLKSNIFFEKSENEKFKTKSNWDLNEYARRYDNNMFKLKRLNNEVPSPNTPISKSNTVNCFENKIEKNVGIKISSELKNSCSDMRLIKNNIRQNSFDSKDFIK